MMDLKIGRHTYHITEKDKFMDNGNCVSLLTQSKEKMDWGRHPDPYLSKKAISLIAKFGRNQLGHGYGERVQIFTLKTA